LNRTISVPKGERDRLKGLASASCFLAADNKHSINELFGIKLLWSLHGERFGIRKTTSVQRRQGKEADNGKIRAYNKPPKRAKRSGEKAI